MEESKFFLEAAADMAKAVEVQSFIQGWLMCVSCLFTS